VDYLSNPRAIDPDAGPVTVMIGVSGSGEWMDRLELGGTPSPRAGRQLVDDSTGRSNRRRVKSLFSMKAVSKGRRRQAYVYALVTTGIVLLFALAEWWTEKYVSDHSRVASTAIVLVGTLVFRPIHERVEAAVEEVFTKRRREAREALARLRKELTSFNDAGQILRRTIEAIDHHMQAAGSAIYLRRDHYRAEASSYDTPAEPVELDDALAVRLRSTGAAADPRALKSLAVGIIAFPMMAGGELVGFLCVTPRSIEFEREDHQILAALAEAVGLALIVLDPKLRPPHGETRPNNLPAGLQPLIGRDDELVEIKSLFETARLVTLTGAGGVGKTRTALQIATDMLRAHDGVWFVDLAPLVDPMLVSSAIADVLGIADEGGLRPLIERVSMALKTQRVLIVIDNCEHLIGAAAEAADHLLRGCPGTFILATSREPLGIAGEERFHMPSLPVPPDGAEMTAERLLQFGGVALFVARARNAQRDFVLTDQNAAHVAEIVRRLDGIALAIELAAPRIVVLSLEQLTQRLDERFALLSGGWRTARPRHQTLRALIGWSYDLLGEAERRLLRRSAIFRGAWTLEAAEAICEDTPHADATFVQTLSALVDKSLIAVENDGENRRYRLLESTRQYAAEQLNAAAEREAVALRHGSFFANAALRANDAFWQTDSDSWAAHARRDLENYRAAISWGLSADGDRAVAETIVASLRWLWYASARREGRALLAQVEPGSSADPRIRGLLGLAAAVLDNSAKAAVPAAAAAQAFLSCSDELGRTEALTFQGTANGRAGQLAESVAFFEQALSAARVSQATRLIGWVASMAAYWFGAAGNRERARALFDEAADVLHACNDPWQLARLQVNRAEFLFAQGDVAGALAGARAAEAVFRARNSDSGICVSVLNQTAYLFAQGALDQIWLSTREGLEVALKAAMSIPTAISHSARLAAETGDPVRAARLLGYADEGYRRSGSTREPTDQREYDRALQLIAAHLSTDRVRLLLAEGAALDVDAAAAQARAIPQPHDTRASLTA
jgi:predicted ATPase